jgi:hypothetical protein
VVAVLVFTALALAGAAPGARTDSPAGARPALADRVS